MALTCERAVLLFIYLKTTDHSMSSNNKLIIGLFGFGVVGEGIYQVLQQTPSLNAVVKKICIKDPHKKRSIAPDYFTTDYNDIFYNYTGLNRKVSRSVYIR